MAAYDYRAQAYRMAGAGNEKLVNVVAATLHYNESLHMHDLANAEHGKCSYCWLRAGRAVRALAEVTTFSAVATS